ncbi:uncharacterized protein METZ01_LOCUS277653, partial [marine metagenome]
MASLAPTFKWQQSAHKLMHLFTPLGLGPVKPFNSLP